MVGAGPTSLTQRGIIPVGRGKEYKQILSRLSLNKARKVRRDRDFEVFEAHNRIKKLLIEEERTTKKLEATRIKVQLFTDIQVENYRKKQKEHSAERYQSI